MILALIRIFTHIKFLWCFGYIHLTITLIYSTAHYIDVDEATIIEVLVKRSNSQRQQIKAVYQQMAGEVCNDNRFLIIFNKYIHSIPHPPTCGYN